MRGCAVILMLEFQSSVDFPMPLRIRQYVDNHHMEMWKGRRFSATDRLQPVLAIMLYTGDSPWSAADRRDRQGVHTRQRRCHDSKAVSFVSVRGSVPAVARHFLGCANRRLC